MVYRAELLVALPDHIDLPAGVAFLEAAGELGLLLLGEVLHAVAKQAADLIERVVLVAAMTQRVLLDTATDLVDDLGVRANDMEGVGHVRSQVQPWASMPVWNFVELGHPFPDDQGGTITTQQMRAAVWSSIINGARGIIYFVHNFGGPAAPITFFATTAETRSAPS